jgi:uncharacterized repeat protein (TIGR01451 family)
MLKRQFVSPVFFCSFTLLLLFPGVAYSSSCICGFVDGQPSLASTLNPVAIDGDMSDWGIFIADYDNNACDGPATNPNPPPDPWPDRDIQPVSEGRDLVQFTWTYDQTYLYLYTARTDTASNNNINKFVYYADIDNDGLVETGEPVIGAIWQGSNQNVNVSIGSYVAFAPSGDATVDSLGFGDGYSMPGTVDKNSIYAVGSGAWGSTDGLSMEFAIQWVAHLGVAPGTGHTIHVSSANANLQQPSLPAQIDDNIGGCGGGGASTQYADLDFSNAYTLSGYWGDTVWGLHHLVNLGNGDDSFAFASTTSSAWAPSVTYYLDDGNSISIFDTGDSVIAGTVALASGSSVDIFTVYTVPSFSSGIATVVTTATSQFNTAVTDSVTDTVNAHYPNISSMKYISGVADSLAATPAGADKALPGSVITYTITVSNNGNAPPNTDTLVVRDNVPSTVSMYIGTGATSPVTFVQGTTLLSYTYSGLASTGDDIAFTSEASASPAYTYTPVPVSGYDSAVTGFKIEPKGDFDGSTSFDLTYEVMIP